MREILFRGKTVGFEDSKWVYGDLIATDPYRIIDMSKGIDFYVFKETVGQWTGKMRVDGTKLFEGDVFWDADYEQEFAVEWNSEVLAWVATDDSNGSEFLSDIWNDSCTILRSIHDTPELLEGAAE